LGIYVETLIDGEMEEVWRLTQTPELHTRWDLRFSDIEYLPREETGLQQFLYTTRIGCGVRICGEGETVGERVQTSDRTSALKFWSDDPKALIEEGSGYWRYATTPEGVRFLTHYDYRVRFGLIGRIVDRIAFRPLLGWATAWSFDRLRLWIEKQIDPDLSLRLSLIHAVARIILAFVWVYQGLVPKILYMHSDELALLELSGASPSAAPTILQIVGWAEVALGLSMLLWFHCRWHFLLTMVLMVAALICVAFTAQSYLVAAFNPVSLNVSVLALAAIGWVVSEDLPSASHCLRKPPKE
jgi:hypothetical protein